MLVKPEEVGLSSGRLGRISDHLRRYIDAGKLSGTLTLVARRGKIAYFEPLGHLEIERKRPVAPDSMFRIYSMTKPIASVGLMMLWEQGRLQLDDPVHKFIPSWRDQRVFVGGNHPAWKTTPVERPVTVRDLLSHTSGLTPMDSWSAPTSTPLIASSASRIAHAVATRRGTWWRSSRRCRSNSLPGRAGTIPSRRTWSAT